MYSPSSDTAQTQAIASWFFRGKRGHSQLPVLCPQPLTILQSVNGVTSLQNPIHIPHVLSTQPKQSLCLSPLLGPQRSPCLGPTFCRFLTC